MINSRPDVEQAPSMQASPRLQARHRRGKIFIAVCAFSSFIGILMLAALLSDIVSDSTGWVAERVDRDPRMFTLLLAEDAQFEAQAREVDSALFKKIDAKLKSKQRSADKDGRVLGDADLKQIRLDVLHGMYTKDAAYFEQFGMQPTGAQRLGVTGAIISDIFTSYPSRHPTKAGIKSAIAGSIWLLLLTALIAIPVGIAAAVYLEEYAAKNRLTQLISINIANLAGVPSIIYGILGLAVFVRGFGFGRSVLAGAATMSLLILPVIIIAAREALKAVPGTLRTSAFAVGATRWQVTRHHVLPAAVPGIMTGVILAMSRAIGETAPMIMIGALSYVAFVPQSPMDDFTVLPIQIFNWIAMPQHEFHMLGACGILVLLIVLLIMNGTAIYIRHRVQKELKW